MKVADLFCGGGGISEGLRLAGCEIVFGLDNSRAAIDTFKRNHQKAEVTQSSVENMDINSLPDFDILVGGPPCVEFSASKQGRGDILAGLKLVQIFLKVVYERHPRYWIMENVPKIVMHLPDKIPLKWIGIDKLGYLEVPVRGEYNAADYGVPQARKRFLMGNYPVPSATHYSRDTDSLFGIAEGRQEWLCLSDVLKSFPSPLSEPFSGEKVTDPNFNFDLGIEELSDHFHEVVLSSGESRQLRKAKEAHPFMGWMPFPDRVDRPARTVVATQLGRETLIIGESIAQKEIFRRATVRECATIQGYPITYQFLGSSLPARYRVVGNGVPPKLIYSIGKEIMRQVGMPVPRNPKVQKRPPELSEPITFLVQKKKQTFKKNRRFCELVPGKEVRGCRVELTNMGGNPHSVAGFTKNSKHIVEWVSRLTVGEGKARTNHKNFSLDESAAFIKPLIQSERERLLECLTEIRLTMPSRLSDASTLQRMWTRNISKGIHPYDVVESLSKIIDHHFPKVEYSEKLVFVGPCFDWLPKKGVRVRLAISLFATAYCCEIINNCPKWAQINESSRYIDSDWKMSRRGESQEQRALQNKLLKAMNL